MPSYRSSSEGSPPVLDQPHSKQIPFHFYKSNSGGESIVMGSNSFDLETKVPGIQYYASADNFKMIYDDNDYIFELNLMFRDYYQKILKW